MAEPAYSNVHDEKTRKSSVKESGTVSYSEVDFTSADYVKMNDRIQLTSVDEEGEEMESVRYSKLNRDEPLVANQFKTDSAEIYSCPTTEELFHEKLSKLNTSPRKKAISRGIMYMLAASVVLILILLFAVLLFCIFIWFEISELKAAPATVAASGQVTSSALSSQVTIFDDLLLQNLSKIDNRIQQVSDQVMQQYSILTIPSCSALPQSLPSGYYWVKTTSYSAVRVYCDTTRSCGGVTGGWTRLYFLNMTNSSQQCPSSLRQRMDGTVRTCGINTTGNGAGCSQVILSTSGLSYSRICGRIRAYQVGSSDTFGNTGRGTNIDINGNYVDGVSLTYGDPRQHIWTFAAALDEVATYPPANCMCINTQQQEGNPPVPSFVGNDYFCDTGSTNMFVNSFFYGDDPLWDGDGCGPLNTCCTFNTPPWFHRQLPQPTTSNIEMRVCRDQHLDDEDTAIELIEIYVQ